MTTWKQTMVTKRDGTVVPYSTDKILSAVEKAFIANGQKFTIEVKQNLLSKLKIYDGISVEEIQEQVQNALMAGGHFKIAAAFIKYRADHNESRFIRERIDYMDKYVQSSDNAATSSETDPNANVTQKNVANLEGEVYKEKNRIVQRQRMKDKLYKMFPEVAKQYEVDLNHHIIYSHDEASTPVLKQYTYSPTEVVEVRHDGSSLLTSLQTLYNEVQCPEVLKDATNNVWCKHPTNLYVRDRLGWTKIIQLTKKERHRDLVRVKTASGEDIVVTDNHPMIVSDNRNDTIDAGWSAGRQQLRLDNQLTFEDISVLDMAACVEDTDVRSNCVISQEDYSTPYYYTKRFVVLDRSLGYVVGLFIGDGSYGSTPGNLVFSHQDKETINNLAERLFNVFGAVSYSVADSPGVWHVKVSKLVEQVFRNYFKIKDKAEDKCLPYNLLMFNEDFARGIIEGLIDSNGTVESNSASITIILNSRECILQLAKLLRHFKYDVAISHQAPSFESDQKIATECDFWGITFTNTPKTVSFDGSYRWQTEVTHTIDSSPECLTGWTTITDVKKIEDSPFLDKCSYIYDISTVSNTFDCNGLWSHNCMAVSLYPLMNEGVGNIDGITPSAPNDLQSFSGQITNLTFLLSSQCKGAIALSEYFVALNWYVIQEFGDKWYEKLDCTITSPHCTQQRTLRDSIHKAFKQFLYGVNQPAGNRSYQSPLKTLVFSNKFCILQHKNNLRLWPHIEKI